MQHNMNLLDITQTYESYELFESSEDFEKEIVIDINCLKQIYESSEYLINLLDININNDDDDEDKDNDDDKIQFEISNALKNVYQNLNLNTKCTYKEYIQYIIDLIYDHTSIKFNKDNILICVIVSDYIHLYNVDKFFDYVIEKFIFANDNTITINFMFVNYDDTFYKNLYSYEPLNYYILDKLSKKNDLSDKTLNYILNTNKNMITDITKLYSKRIKQQTLNKLINIVELNIECNGNVTNFNHLKNLYKLNVSGIRNTVTQAGIFNLKNIKILNLESNKHITDLNHLDKLVELDISGYFNAVTQVGISNLQNIEILNAYSNHNITCVSHLNKLVELNVKCSSEISQTNISQITSLIETLDVSYTMNITDINHLTNIKKLNISSCLLNITNDGISNLNNVTHLNLRDNSKITKINHMKNIKELDISCILSKIIQNDITELTNVEVLNIYENENITNINHMKKLKKITLNETMTDDGISELTNVEILYLQNNKFITNINHLTKLTELYIGKNRNINMLGISKLKNLEIVKFHSNPNFQIEDLNGIIANNKCIKYDELFDNFNKSYLEMFDGLGFGKTTYMQKIIILSATPYPSQTTNASEIIELLNYLKIDDN